MCNFFLNISRIDRTLHVNGVDICSGKCTNKLIRQLLYKNRSIKPRGKFFWDTYFENIIWKKLGCFHLVFAYLTRFENYI